MAWFWDAPAGKTGLAENPTIRTTRPKGTPFGFGAHLAKQPSSQAAKPRKVKPKARKR